jgi:hypothetical protein
MFPIYICTLCTRTASRSASSRGSVSGLFQCDPGIRDNSADRFSDDGIACLRAPEQAVGVAASEYAARARYGDFQGDEGFGVEVEAYGYLWTVWGDCGAMATMGLLRWTWNCQ